MKVKALLVIVAIALIGCVSNDLPLDTIHGALGREAIVKERQTVVFDDPDEEIKIEVSAIHDSRCPIDVLCISEGFVQVTFKISAISDPVDLAIPSGLPQRPNDSYSFTFSGDSYRLVLKAVTPLPKRDNIGVKRSAVFELQRI